MTKKEALQLFEEKKIRSVWDDKEAFSQTRNYRTLDKVEFSCFHNELARQ